MPKGVTIPEFQNRPRVIIDTDAKNEADDQYAIVHALLSPSLDLRGFVAAHFGTRPDKSVRSMKDSKEEIDLLVRLLGMEGRHRVEEGAAVALPDAKTPVVSAGADLIVEECLREDPRRLYIAFFGPLTDMATALMLHPEIAERDVTVIWIGGSSYDRATHPRYWPEFNLVNDLVAANIVFSSAIDVWQIPMSVYLQMAVTYAELVDKVAPHGEIGRYLAQQLFDWNAKYVQQAMEYRSLGDSPAVGVLLNPYCGEFETRPAPNFRWDASYDFSRENRPIRVYKDIDTRFVLDDFFAKLKLFAEGESLV